MKPLVTLFIISVLLLSLALCSVTSVGARANSQRGDEAAPKATSPQRAQCLSPQEKLKGRRRTAFNVIIRARLFFDDLEGEAESLRSSPTPPTNEELDAYMLKVFKCLKDALQGYFFIGPNQVLPSESYDLAAALDKMPDDSFDELIWPLSLDDLVVSGIIPSLPSLPGTASGRLMTYAAPPASFTKLSIVYFPVVSKKGYWRNEGGYPEGAVLLCYGSTEQSKPDSENQEYLGWVLSILRKDKLPAGVVGYFVQRADEPAK